MKEVSLLSCAMCYYTVTMFTVISAVFNISNHNLVASPIPIDLIYSQLKGTTFDQGIDYF